MERTVAPSTPVPDGGFTLIELLVAVAVLSVLAVGATLTVARPSGPGDAETFRAAWEAQRDLSVAGRELRGLSVGPDGLTPMTRRYGTWRAAGRPRRLSARAALSPAPAPGAPGIVFVPTGESAPFTVSFGRGRCESDGAVLTC